MMKTLEKDRNRRYETANGFAMDIQRFLADETVLACPPSVGYRLRKFARRNKAGLTMAGVILFFLVLLGGGLGWMLRDREAREQELARDRAAGLTRFGFFMKGYWRPAASSARPSSPKSVETSQWHTEFARFARGTRRSLGLGLAKRSSHFAEE
ncbi:MAG: hypothetical protein WD468_06155 [Pirellulales bacterium]